MKTPITVACEKQIAEPAVLVAAADEGLCHASGTWALEGGAIATRLDLMTYLPRPMGVFPGDIERVPSRPAMSSTVAY
jgi:hypothetical protein